MKLSRIMQQLLNGEEVTLKEENGKILEELCIDDEGNFRHSYLCSNGEYDQDEITDYFALHLLKENYYNMGLE